MEVALLVAGFNCFMLMKVIEAEVRLITKVIMEH